MQSKTFSLLKYLLGWPLSLLAFFFIIKIVWSQLPSLLPHVEHMHVSLVIYGILSFIIFYFIRSYLWYRIIRGFGYKLSFKESSYLWSISELKRYIPGSIWSFLGRAVLFSKKGVSKKDMSIGLIIEAELFVLGCFVVSLLSLPYFIPKYLSEIIWLILVLVGVIVGLYAYNRKFLKFSFSHIIFPPFKPYENLFLIGLSACALLFFGMGNYFIMTAAFVTNLQLFPQLVGVFVLAFVGGYLSILTPAGFGVREGIVIYALTKIVPGGLAAFAALFTRIMLIIAELIFILLGYLWFTAKNAFIKKAEDVLSTHPYEAIVVGLSAIYALYFITLSILRYDNYYTGRFDLGNMDQTVWNTLHGNFFQMTDPNGVENLSRLAFHADFILIFLAPFYMLWEDPRMLLIIQTVVVAAGAYFVFLISRNVLKNKNIALILSFALLLNPGVQRANLYDFHAVTLATTFLLAMFYFYLKRKYRFFILFALLAAFCKEQIWLIIGLFGLLVFFHAKKRLLGSLIFFGGIGIFYYLLWHAIPDSLGSQHFALQYYADYGTSPSQIIKTMLLSPNKIFETILAPERIHFLMQLFSPLGYLSVLFPFFIIFAAPDLIISLLSNNAQLYQIYYQYTATITPFIFLSAIYGIWVIRKIVPRFPLSIIGAYVLAFTLYASYSFGPLPGSNEPNTDMFTKPLVNRKVVDAIINSVPDNFSVSASNNLGSHLSQRKYIYVTPLGIDKADLILLQFDDPKASATESLVRKDENYRQVIDEDGFIGFVKKK